VEGEVHVFADALAIEAGEESGRGGAVKTLVVVEDFYLQAAPSCPLFPARQKWIGISSRGQSVKSSRWDGIFEAKKNAARRPRFSRTTNLLVGLVCCHLADDGRSEEHT